MTITQMRYMKHSARARARRTLILSIKKDRRDGLTYTEIAEQYGLPESTARFLAAVKTP